MPRSARAFEAIHAVADRHAPAMRRAFTEAVAAARGGDLRRRLQAALNRGQLDQAYDVAARAWEAIAESDLQLRIAREALATLQQAGELTQNDVVRAMRRAAQPEIRQRVARGVATVGRFDVTNPTAVAWARERAATLVREITEAQRQTIRQALTRNVAGEMSSAKLAKEIQQSIGLLPGKEAAVANFRAELEGLRASLQPMTRSLRVGRVSNRGLTQAKIDAKVEAYRARLLRQRAAVIARTETIAAASEGQLEAWRQARERGDLPPSMWKVWIVTPDDRLCPLCAPLDGQTVPIDQPFRVGILSVMGPPLHPQCRCAMGLQEPRGRRAAA